MRDSEGKEKSVLQMLGQAHRQSEEEIGEEEAATTSSAARNDYEQKAKFSTPQKCQPPCESSRTLKQPRSARTRMCTCLTGFLSSCGRPSELAMERDFMDGSAYLLCYDSKRRRLIKETIKIFWCNLKVLRWPCYIAKGEADSLYWALKEILAMQARYPDYQPIGLDGYLLFCGVFPSFGYRKTVRELQFRINREIDQISELMISLNPASPKVLIFEVPSVSGMESGVKQNGNAVVLIVSEKDESEYVHIFQQLIDLRRNGMDISSLGQQASGEVNMNTTGDDKQAVLLTT